jgi:carboxymethylenebutenolidase
VDHAFFNDDNKAAYDKAAADDAWRRTLSFFRTNLK